MHSVLGYEVASRGIHALFIKQFNHPDLIRFHRMRTYGGLWRG